MKKEKDKKKPPTVLTEKELASAAGGQVSMTDFHFIIG